MSVLAVLVGGAILLAINAPHPAQAKQSAMLAFHSAAVTNANGSSLSMVGRETAVIQWATGCTATLTFQGTVDGTTWNTIALANLANTSRTRATGSTFTNTSGIYLLESSGGLGAVRAVLSGYNSGSCTVKGRAQGP